MPIHDLIKVKGEGGGAWGTSSAVSSKEQTIGKCKLKQKRRLDITKSLYNQGTTVV